MFKQLMKGMAVTLTAGLLAVGCSDDGDTIVQGNSGPLNNNDSIPANSVADNNLAADGGGLSPNDADVNNIKITFCCDCKDSDGTSNADNTAIILFDTQNTSSGQRRVYGTYMSNGGLSMPTELKAPDRDYQVAVSLNSYVAICISTSGFTTTDTTAQADAIANNGKWLIIGDYTTFTNDPRNSTTQATAGVLGPHVAIAYWIFDPALAGSGITSSTQIGAVGTTAGTARTFENGFLQTGIQLETARGGGTQTSTATTLGGSSTVDNNYVNAPACDVTSYGLISDGFCGQTSFGGEALPMADQIPNRTNGNNGTDVDAAAAKAYSFAYPNTNDAQLRSSQFMMGERTNFIGLFYTQVVSSVADASTNLTESYTARGTAALAQDMNHGGAQLQLKFQGFNMATLQFGTESRIDPAAARTTRGTANTAGTLSGVGFYPDFFGYNGFAFVKYCDASLRTTTGGETTTINGDNIFHALGITPFDSAGTTTDNHLWNYEQTGGHYGNNLTTRAMYEDVCAVLRIADGGAAEAALASVGATGTTAGQPYDLTMWNASAGVHDTTNPSRGASTVLGNQFHIAPNREVQNYNLSTKGSKGWRFIYGADESLGDVTVFYTSADNTRQTETDAATAAAGGISNNIQRQLMAASFNFDGTLVTTTDTFNPRQVSTHKDDFVENPVGAGAPGPSLTAESGSGATTVDTDGALQDPLETLATGTNSAVFFDACMNRTGDYVAIGYMQDEGTSVSFRQALKAVAYQTFRSSYALTAMVTVSQTSFNNRFAGPVDLSTRSDALANITLGGFGTASTTRDDNANGTPDLLEARNSSRVWSALPVNDFCWQGKTGYRCGFQSDELILNVLYEQSDATEDVVYVRAINIVPDFRSSSGFANGTPTIENGTTNVDSVQLVSTAAVQGHSNYVTRNISSGYASDSAIAAGRNTFRFINGDVNLGTTVQACDLGASVDSSGTSTGGGLLIVWRQITDATTSDNDLADMDIFAARFGDTANAVTDIINIGKDVNEDGNVAPIGNTATNVRALIQDGDDGFAASPANTADVNALTSSNTGVGSSNYTGLNTGGFDTGAAIKLVCVPNNTDIQNNRSYSGDAVYIYFLGSGQTNISGSKALFTRKFDATIRGNAQLASQTASFGLRIFPNVDGGPGTGGSFADPTRLDHEQGGDVNTQIDCCQSGNAVAVFFQQDGHVWYQATADGLTYLAVNGSANPSLADNDDSENVVTWSVVCCTDSNGDFVNGIFCFTKQDQTGNDLRLRKRLVFGVQ